MFSENAVTGKGNIIAEVVADSVNAWDDRLTTFRLHYPRFIHSEALTHRMFSKNSSSSRAIPAQKMIEQVWETPAEPIHWGKNQPGMSANEELTGVNLTQVQRLWRYSSRQMCANADMMNSDNAHKQIINRILEPWQFMNVVCSMTDIENFFHLRYHPAAQPEIQELAKVMYEARKNSTPICLRVGEWHLPYVDVKKDGSNITYSVNGEELDLDTAKKVSASCCAQASYRKLDTTVEKALDIYEKLVKMEPIHASPFEHQATPFSESEYMARHNVKKQLMGLIGKEVSEIMYNGNFRGWTQFRKEFPNENVRKKFLPKD